ncbi:MAG TPA: 4Fe-4S binding protein [Candidatus Hydrogenedentes bacterium]|nr:4Fe-4S binding protein [Candidatus Hydrogenedentota bacterium]
MKKTLASIFVGIVVLSLAPHVGAIEVELKFEPPDFETAYVLPDIYAPAPDSTFGWWDSVILFAALSLATWFVFKSRSRRGLFLLSIFSLGFFGFYRNGCICPVGSTQNVMAAVFIPDVGVSAIVVSFFVLPLLFSLFFGRVFCASVCPLGAIQELVAVAPIRISPALERVLGLGKYIYLGLATLGVATGAGFLVCRYDPFVGIYRMGHSYNMLLAGAAILILGVFVARPYCRFLCPYGVLLGWMSYFSKFHLDIPPSPCVSCRLCEDSCPYNAIDMPTPASLVDKPEIGKKRIRITLLASPLLILAGAVIGYMMYEPLSRMHPTVSLSEQIALEDRGVMTGENLDTDTFRTSDITTEQLHLDADAVRETFKTGGAWFGAFIMLIVSLKLVGLSIVKKRDIFTPRKEACYSCGRCYPYCPVEEEEQEMGSHAA